MYSIKQVSAEEFHELFMLTRQLHKEIRRRTSPMDLGEYKRKFKCYQVVDSNFSVRGPELVAGFAINTATGELCSMFNAEEEHRLGDFMVSEAVRLGAKRLNCRDGFLVKLYAKHGFVPVCAVEHHRHRPDKPKPMIVYMAHKSTPYGAAAVTRPPTCAQAVGVPHLRSGCGDDDDEGCPSRAERRSMPCPRRDE